MTRYLLYFLTGFAYALVILFYRGYVAAPPNTLSTMALVGGMVMFGLASWVKLFFEKPGALLALLCLLAMAPWTVAAGKRLLAYDAFLSGVLLIIHTVLLVFALATLVTSLRYVFSRGSWLSGTAAPGFAVKIVLAAIPVAIVVGWFLVLGKLE